MLHIQNVTLTPPGRKKFKLKRTLVRFEKVIFSNFFGIRPRAGGVKYSAIKIFLEIQKKIINNYVWHFILLVTLIMFDGFGSFFHSLGISGYPLAFCAFLLMTIVIERTYFLLLVAKPIHLKANHSSISRSNSVLFSLVNELLSIKSLPKERREEVMSISFSIAKRQIKMGIGMLKFIGSISPMFGLLGNVLGMVSSFEAISKSTGAVNAVTVSYGLKEAMNTTAVGLGISIPALFAEYFFGFIAQSRLENNFSYINRLNIKLDHLKNKDEES